MGEMRRWAVPLLINFSIDMASQGTWDCKVRLKFSVHWFLPRPLLPFQGKQANNSCTSSHLEFINENHVLECVPSHSYHEPKLLPLPPPQYVTHHVHLQQDMMEEPNSPLAIRIGSCT